MKVKCPHCGGIFESLEHPEPVIKKEVYGADYSSSDHKLRKLKSNITYSMAPKNIGVSLSSVDDTISQQSAFSNRSLPTDTMKKGYKEIFDTIDNHQGATWTELKMGTNLSTATLSKRLREGKQAGIIDEDLRKPEGKKVYIKR